MKLRFTLAALLALVPVSAFADDCGGTITVGGTAQNAVTSLNGAHAIIENPVSATEDLYVATMGSATTTGAGDHADLAPGGSVLVTVAGAVSVNAATTGHRFICTLQ